MIIDAWLNLLRNAVYGDSVTYPSHIAIGTGTTAVLASDTALETEIYPDGANRSAISSRTKPSAKRVKMQMLVGAGEANGLTLTEIGVSNAAISGTFMNRLVHTAITKDASFELKYQVEDTFQEMSNMSAITTVAFAYENITVAGTAIGGTPATYSGATHMELSLETAQIRFRVDGSNPTASVGHLLGTGDTLVLNTAANIAAFRAIRTGAVSGTLRATYFK